MHIFNLVPLLAGLGHQIAAKRLVEVLAMTWAGSQVTKLPRAMGAVLLAPTVANILNELKAALRLRSIQQVSRQLTCPALGLHRTMKKQFVPDHMSLSAGLFSHRWSLSDNCISSVWHCVGFILMKADHGWSGCLNINSLFVSPLGTLSCCL